MKKIIFTLALSMLLLSCSSDDDSVTTTNNDANYYPLTVNSTWDYNNTAETGPTNDRMFVNGTEQTNGQTYTNLDCSEPATGFMMGVLSENLVRKDGAKLLINGALGTPVEGFPDITIPLNDVALFDANSASGTTLSTLSDTLMETVMDLPLTINYTSTSVQGATLDTYTAGTTTFNNVLVSTIVLNLSISTSIQIGGSTLSVPLLSPQEVLVVTNYWAADVGLIYSEAEIDYQLEDLGTIGIELPIPTQDNQVSTSTLVDFSIGE